MNPLGKSSCRFKQLRKPHDGDDLTASRLCFSEQEAKSNSSDSGDLGSLKSSMHPELIKYAKETDQKNTLERKKGRMKLFKISPDFQNRFSKVCFLRSSMSLFVFNFLLININNTFDFFLPK